MDLIKKAKFYQRYSDAFITNKGLDDAYAFKEKFIPETLYRYRRPTQNTLEEVNSSHVCLIPSSKQNDPSDTTLKVDFSLVARELSKLNEENYTKHLSPSALAEELAEIRSAPSPFDGVRDVLFKRSSELNQKKTFLENFFEARVKEIERTYSKAVQEGTLICSFSESNTIPRMWDEYADKGQGICIAYPMQQLDENDPRRRYLFPVNYQDEPFDATADFIAKIKEFNRRNRGAWCASMSKEMIWAEEKEWRLVSFEGRIIEKKFVEMPVPSCIYLGENIDGDYERQIRKLASVKSIPVLKIELINAFWN